MRRVVLSLLAAGLGGCATGLGGGPDVPLSTVALRVDPGTSAAQAAGAINGADADIALVAAPADAGWFASVAQSSRLQLSGPAYEGDLGLAFYGPEALGDTAIELRYEGGTFMLQDALYELDGDQYLDLMAFSVEEDDEVEPLIRSLLSYTATDVMPGASVVIAVAVPNAAVGENVARMLRPGYFNSSRCGDTATSAGDILLFYGPEARARCRDARAERTAAGVRIHAALVAGSP